jgi:alkanesulfonate monooxygenase
MWSGDVGPYEGKYYRLAETLNSPQPLCRPHPPILIGGMGEKKTLRLVAQYGDACNLVLHAGMDALRNRLEMLKRHCEAAGRSYDEIEKTVLGGVQLGPDGMHPEQVVELCRSLAGLGFQHLIVNLPNVHELWPLETFGQFINPTVSEF